MNFLILFWIPFSLCQSQDPVRTFDFVTFVNLFRHTTDLISIVFDSYNQTFQLELTRHKNFVSGAILEVHNEQGVKESPLGIDTLYKGYLMNNGKKLKSSWIRLVLQDEDNVEFEGTISTGTEMYHIKNIDQYRRSQRAGDVKLPSQPDQIKSRLIMIKDEDSSSVTGMCSTSQNCPNEFFRALVKRENLVPTCGTIDDRKSMDVHFKALGLNTADFLANAAAGCPATPRLLLMGVAADCSYVKDKGGRQKALEAILVNWSTVSKVYSNAFNVQLGVGKVVIQESCTPGDPVLTWNRDCSNPAYEISDRLSDFAAWRGQQSDQMGLWHLVTKCSTIPAVGIAWLSTLCQSRSVQQNGQTVSGVGVSAIVPVEWKVMAHEIGHNFGAIHDCTSTTCDNSCSRCSPTCDLMNPTDSSISDSFSPGSISLICNGINKLGSCLIDPGSASLIQEGICGNGVKENGEQCDCGIPSECVNDPCCDAATCKYKPNAVCAFSNEKCCSQTCQFMPAGTLCHSSVGICDTNAYCSGTNGTCATNTYVADGTTCTTDAGVKAYCTSGQCTSRDLQCKTTGTITTVAACPALGNSCQLSCQDAQGACYQLVGNFLDGTTCGGIGRCKNGNCEGSNIFSMAKLLLDTYPYFGYPILILGILFIVSTVWGCIKGCCCSKPRARNPPVSSQRTYVQPSTGTGRNNVTSRQ